MISLQVEGLDFLKKILGTNPSLERALPDINSEILKIHNTLEDEIKNIYTLGKPLSYVWEKGTTGSRTNNGYVLELRYNDIPEPLVNFSHRISDSPAESFAPLRPNYPEFGELFWKKGKWSKKVEVAVRKGKYKVANRFRKTNLKGFYNPRNKQIQARLQEKTWARRPERFFEGERAPYSTLYGPSLATLASRRWETSKKLPNQIDKLESVILDKLLSFYD